MSVNINQSKFSKLLGISRAAVTKAVNQGRIHKTAKGIDPDHPINVLYAASLDARDAGVKPPDFNPLEESPKAKAKDTDKPPKVQAKEKKKTKKTKQTKSSYKPVEVEPHNYDEPTEENQVDAVALRQAIKEDVSQKVAEEIRLKRITADLKTFEYMQKLDAVVDVDTMIEAFSAFYDFLMNGLIYMPEESADMIWMRAKDSDNPEKAITDELKDRIESIVKRAKEAAEKVFPEKGKKRRYVSIEEDE
jgi:hypothetical protein